MQFELCILIYIEFFGTLWNCLLCFKSTKTSYHHIRMYEHKNNMNFAHVLYDILQNKKEFIVHLFGFWQYKCRCFFMFSAVMVRNVLESLPQKQITVYVELGSHMVVTSQVRIFLYYLIILMRTMLYILQICTLVITLFLYALHVTWG